MGVRGVAAMRGVGMRAEAMGGVAHEWGGDERGGHESIGDADDGGGRGKGRAQFESQARYSRSMPLLPLLHEQRRAWPDARRLSRLQQRLPPPAFPRCYLLAGHG